jgi:hypothetical protein
VTRKKVIFILAALVLVAAVVAVIEIWPKKYAIAQTMPQAVVFWHDREAFLFLSLNTTGRAQNVLQQKLSRAKYGYLWAAFIGLEGYIDFAKQDVIAYHLASEGKLDRFPLADHSTLYGSWSLVDGQLELAPPAGSTQSVVGFRWDGAKFVAVSRALPTQAKPETSTKLSADDDEDEGTDYRFLGTAVRQQFKTAGWHYKFLTGYSPDAEATLPIKLAGNAFNLTVESTPFAKGDDASFDLVSYGTKTLRLSGDKLSSAPQVLWSRSGWQTVSKDEYEHLKRQTGHPRYQPRFTWLWLAAVVFLLLFRFGSWFHVLFAFGGVKRRVLKNMSTSYSFPPATPAQFPLLDLEALDRYTSELERMGFTRLLDCSPVSDSPTNPPSFCRLFAHTRHHCWATVNQMFPRGKKPMLLKCSLESSLQNGWTIAFSDRKPMATSSLIRRKKALGVSMPEATPAELLQALLKMREQVCLDLGISPMNDDTLDAYIQKVQRTAGELREAVQGKSFVRGLPEVYLRRFTLLKNKPEYVWLGDYPKEAERRKQGFGSQLTPADVGR